MPHMSMNHPRAEAATGTSTRVCRHEYCLTHPPFDSAKIWQVASGG